MTEDMNMNDTINEPVNTPEPVVSGESIGQILRNAREQRGMSVDQMAELSKLRPRFIQALEEDNYDALPNKIAGRGFLKIYADRLGLDVRGLTSRFDEKFPQKTISANTIQRSTERKFSIVPEGTTTPLVPKPLMTSPMRGPSTHQTFMSYMTKQYRHYFYYALGGAFILFLVMYTTSLFMQDMNKTPGRVPSGDIRPIQATPEQMLYQQTGFMGVVVVVRPQGRTWMRSYVDGFLNYKGPIERGAVKEFRGRQYVRVKVGNGSLVDLLVNGQYVGKLTSENVIVDKRFYPLAPEISASMNAVDYREPEEIVAERLRGDVPTLNTTPPEGERSWEEQLQKSKEYKEKEKAGETPEKKPVEGW